jgi:hypothetical protein
MLIMPLIGNVFYESADLGACQAKAPASSLGCRLSRHASRHRPGSHSCWGRCRRRLAATGLRRGHVKSGIPSKWLSDKDGSYQDKQLDNSGCGGVFFSSGGPGDFRRARRMLTAAAGASAGACPARAALARRPRPRRGRRTGLAEVLTRPADQSIFVETFPNVTSVTHEAHRFGAFVPGPNVCSLAPRWGRLRDWRVPRAARQ